MATNITVVIPTYEMRGMWKQYLKRNLDILAKQTYKDFDVVVSDDSTHFVQSTIELMCKSYPFVTYVRNQGEKGISSNLNNAIKHATGNKIKILFQDDFLLGDDALQDIALNFKGNWMVTACEHSPDGVNMVRPFYPKYNDDIINGNNTISSPSVLTILNQDPLLFDENLNMFMDCDYYRRCYDKFGEPTIMNIINVVNTVGEHQESLNIKPEKIQEEKKYIKKKYV